MGRKGGGLRTRNQVLYRRGEKELNQVNSTPRGSTVKVHECTQKRSPVRKSKKRTDKRYKRGVACVNVGFLTYVRRVTPVVSKRPLDTPFMTYFNKIFIYKNSLVTFFSKTFFRKTGLTDQWVGREETTGTE